MESFPADIMEEIASRLSELEDFVALSAVSKSWHSAVASCLKKSPPPLAVLLKFPMLMQQEAAEGQEKIVVEPDELQEKTTRRDFSRLLDGRTYSFRFPFDQMMMMRSGRSCLGMSHGWLLTWIPGSDVNLIHPFKRLKIDLPMLSGSLLDDAGHPRSPEQYFIKKAVVTEAPWVGGRINPNCVVLAIVGYHCGVWSCKLRDLIDDDNKTKKSGEAEWTIVDPTRYYSDITYHKGDIYTVYGNGNVYRTDYHDPKSKSSYGGKQVQKGSGYLGNGRTYLVSSISGDLLVVERVYGGQHYTYGGQCCNNENCYVTIGFLVRKLVAVEDDEEDELGQVLVRHRYKCERVHNLRVDEALFIGQCSNSSISLTIATNLLGARRGVLRPNCIYFTDDNSWFFPDVGGGHDLGVFSLTDVTVTPFYTGKRSLSKSCPPLWYM